ncbi:MAG: amidase [Intrasporangium sp.]|uniref:amidase n=1 Tax=Intrasporangium sp. TaxID=1925024 RepID=UPI0026473344|nr:amidase [Intrasporangium sp.]MDN5794877.1 amidase [Intrasporangium sp.]
MTRKVRRPPDLPDAPDRAPSRCRPAGLDATELLAAYTTGDLSPVEVVQDICALIAEREPELNAFWVHDPEHALEEARASEHRWSVGRPLGPLDGVPVTVKENLARSGIPMPAGTAGVVPIVPRRNCPVVDRIQESGGVILGSTVMPDWGMLSSGVSSLHGITRSPWDPSLTTGGSSSGAGAAAAGGYGPLHVGTDIGGSVRLPGTWLGLTTLKPSFGRVPLSAPYLGRVAGPITRSARDAALLLGVISRADPRDWTSLPAQELRLDDVVADPPLESVEGLRIGLHLDAGAGLPLDPEVRAAVAQAAALFERAGARVEQVPPFINEGTLTDLDQFWRVRSLVDLEALPAKRQQRVLPFIRRWVTAAAEVDGRRVLRDYSSIMSLQKATTRATEQFDFVLSPVAPVASFPAEHPMPWGETDLGMAHIGYTVPFSMSGQPAATTNCGFTADGRTIGLQVSGRRFDDVGVLRAVNWYEHHRPAGTAPVWPIPAREWERT